MCSTKYEPQCQQGSEKKCDTVTETVNEQVAIVVISSMLKC